MSIRRVLLLCSAMCLAALPLSAQQYTIKFATLAPEGSTWMKIMREFDTTVRTESGGRLGLQTVPGRCRLR